ncbi:diguanylate cyclase [Sulfurimonas sp. SAG-AH-194-C21]|nr:diguanylate cyclase [Sulfurimonas sp. SAG-AH-194-C21]
MKKNLFSMIEQKKSATVAIALSIAAHNDLPSVIQKKDFSNIGYKKLIEKLKNDTFYKNIWIHIIDPNGVSLYRSWTGKCGDCILSFREDIVNVLKTQKTTSLISVGKFNLSLKAIVPIFKDGKLIGIVEVISHLNSISEELKKLDVDSLIIVDKENTKKIKVPFTNIYIDDYYIANFDAPLELREYVQKRGTDTYLKEGYKVENPYIIVSYTLRDAQDKGIASYLMFKNISEISTTGLEYSIFKLFSLFIFLFMFIVIIIVILLYNANKKQKEYYKNIIDSSTDIMIIKNRKSILFVNKAFFDYFGRYDNMDSFIAQHGCISELFDKDSKYLQKEMNGENWLTYLLKNRGKYFKAKVIFFNKVYYFSIATSLISQKREHYSITFSDITQEENYKQELENLTVTDPLTKIGNRRHYQNKIEEEISKAYRYKSPLSLMIFDIDKFKSVNDIHGHDIGDKVLIEYTSLVESQLRNTDSICRIGGEEFVIITPNIKIEDAYALAQKLRVMIEEHKKIIPITVSFGVSEYISGESVEDIFKRVDKALYTAKNGGRNKVVKA